jgi:hypothetical protein
VEFSVCRPSPLNTYSYVREENLGSIRKLVQNFLFVYVYFQPNSCNTHADREWVRGTFLRQWRKVSPAHVQQVYYGGEVQWGSELGFDSFVCWYCSYVRKLGRC